MSSTMSGFVPIRAGKGALTVKKSMYTQVVDNGDGDGLLYNTLTGAFYKAPLARLQFLMGPGTSHFPVSDLTALQSFLFDKGFLVPGDADEFRRSRMLHDTRMRMGSGSRYELILLPHENCNFRCDYCYETFARNKMEPWVRESIKRFVVDRSKRLELLEVSWFGGEPTYAMDVVAELSASLIDICNQNDARYKAQITTNGYALTDEVARKLIFDYKVGQFQITLDGPPEEHNKRRHLAGGGKTFDQIYANLLNLRKIDAEFAVIIRVNFDVDNAPVMQGLTDMIGRDFGQDGRFLAHFFPISRWGGARDGALPICDATMGRLLKYQLLEAAVDKGFGSRIRHEISPNGTACYAADPNSFIIGADGTIYKCTVAFEDERNKVGKMQPDGSMRIDLDRYGLWVVNDGVTDEHCQSCFFSPSCHGVSCPLWRMESGESPCPSVKEEFPYALKILAKELAQEGARVL
jgi:uncharacterized protein